MTDLVVFQASTTIEPAEAPKLVKMRAFGVGKAPTLAISMWTAAVLIALWGGVSYLRLVPHLFLPTPGEVVTFRSFRRRFMESA